MGGLSWCLLKVHTQCEEEEQSALSNQSKARLCTSGLAAFIASLSPASPVQVETVAFS